MFPVSCDKPHLFYESLDVYFRLITFLLNSGLSLIFPGFLPFFMKSEGVSGFEQEGHVSKANARRTGDARRTGALIWFLTANRRASPNGLGSEKPTHGRK
ncbi:unnamed protein product [Sphacelaria rigidula]